MKLLLLVGDGAVGKMTVGQELMKQTGLRLFHNHMTIEPVLEIFGQFHPDVILKMRDVIFREFAKTDNYGMINYMKIDNSDLEPAVVAAMIKERFQL